MKRESNKYHYDRRIDKPMILKSEFIWAKYYTNKMPPTYSCIYILCEENTIEDIKSIFLDEFYRKH